ncbi:oligosaccharide flippase family protein [Clostridium sp. P21]|uniref:Oligosaccharide flippase family protein n=1 Tax=Clostridium muellerianum TaxID=2716538 RepID=A0A7Y0EKE3_9CLOT|nr:oligosaccharide flippase family protein [Clostridium muellerianum]NMM65090.1 oligosaccharide flippase family protein [Clostridium muellerianum]
MKKTIKFNSILNIVYTTLKILFPIITFPYASRILGPTEIGRINFANTFISYFILLASLGIPTYAIRECAKVKDDKSKLNSVYSELLSLNFIFTFISYLCLVVVLNTFDFNKYKNLIYFYSISIIFTTIGVSWIFNVFEKYFYIIMRSLIFQVISLILLFVFVKSKNDYMIYAGLIIFSNVGSNILDFGYARKFVTFSLKSISNIKRHIKPILIMFSVTIASTIYVNLDVTILGMLKSAREVGLYTAATKINLALVTLISSISTVLLPRLSYYISRNNTDKYDYLIYKTVDFIMMVAIPISVGLFVLSKDIIVLFSGIGFIDAFMQMRILAIGICCSRLNYIIAIQIFIPIDKEKYSLYSTLCGAIVNCILNYFMIPKWGGNGAAVATVISEIIVLLCCLYLLNRLNYMNKFIKCLGNCWQYILASFEIVIIAIFINKINSNLIQKLFLIVMISIISYFISLFLLKNENIYSIFKFLKNKSYQSCK